MSKPMREREIFQKSLLQWYCQEARILPWRSNPSSYNVWISEIMLQQTRVDVVIPYFSRFIENIPTVDALAQIGEDQLLKLWQGLGYYGRALNLKRAAQMVMQEFNGDIPSAVQDLILLPGIGDYTAGAIASIAYGKREPAVDGNVLRIVARILDSKENIDRSKTKKVFKDYIKGLLPLERPGDFNQALMDLGAQICLPNGEPKCAQCPLSNNCLAYLREHTWDVPVRSPKKVRKIDKRTVLVICHKGRYALNKRGRGLLANLWEFPNIEGHLTKEQCQCWLQGYGMVPAGLVELSSAKHIFTHLEWHMRGYYVEIEELKSSIDFVWATENEISKIYSVPSAFNHYLGMCFANNGRREA
ncbi:MAG: A/G-specific adenine glycosylase [Clostridia bacterium]|nr:A/G-specific adenine glycosylase [Clostridia bacterium]